MSVDPAEDGWVSTTQAAQILGMDGETIRRRCREGRYRTRREWRGQLCCWLINRDELEAEKALKEQRAALKADGHKWCPSCQAWKKLEEFWKKNAYCISCSKAKKRWTPGEALGGSVEDYVAPKVASDGTEYACQDFGFHAKPLPMRDGERVSKREAYCQICKARYCLHYKDQRITPKELVRRWKLSRGRIAAGM